MYQGDITKRLTVLGGLLVSSLLVWVMPYLSNGNFDLSALGIEGFGSTADVLTVTFLDVGQGDSILIETPDGIQMLIDGGPDGTVLRRLSHELPWFDRTIDIILGTHPDKDHIGGLVDVLHRYTVGQIITTENTGETMVSSSFQKGLVQEGATVTMARSGQVYQLGASTTLTILAPKNNPEMLESNTASIVAKLSYGDIDFMLTGDAPSSIEEYLVKTYGEGLSSEVLKLGHHGSKTASSESFLDTVKPMYAVVSAGKDNSYGHPHPQVVDAVNGRNIQMVSTAESGSLTFESDGIKVWLK
jgi:competence protein ComEC